MIALLAQLRQTPVASVWLVAPLAVAVALLVMWHLIVVSRAKMPESRRRIRTATGLIIIVALPVMVYALSVAAPAQGRAFIISWTTVGALTAIVAFLAALDALNSGRLYVKQQRELAKAHAADLRSTVTPRHSPGGSVHEPPPPHQGDTP